MPTYDYACSACGEIVEVVHGVHVDGPTVCPLCGSGPIRKVFAAPTVVFKGSGWAKVDRRTTAKAAAASKATDKDASAGSKPAGEGGASSSESSAESGNAAAASRAAPETGSSETKSSSTGPSTTATRD